MHRNNAGDLIPDLLSELAEYYAQQQEIAKLPREERIAGCVGAIEQIAQKINVEKNARVLAATLPTLRQPTG